MMQLANSPAEILRMALVNGNQVSMPVPGIDSIWPAYVASIPNAPDQVVVFSNGIGLLDGRIFRTGEVIEHPGVQIRVRALDETTAYAQAAALTEYMAKIIKRTSVVIASNTYTIQNVKRTSSIVSMGEEPGTKRQWVSVNVRLTL